MDRRLFLSSLRKSSAKENITISGGLAPYTGEWTKAEAAHLLRRTLYGPTIDEIDTIAQMGMDLAVEEILTDDTEWDLPVNYDFEGDPDVAIGETWIEAPHSVANVANNYRSRSMVAWVNSLMMDSRTSIRSKMILFWHNHFPIEGIRDARYSYRYYKTLDEHHLGSFRQLVKDITIDPSMLRYLNGNQNRVQAPNENYARELLELFTIGKGPQIGPGDYTNYTEDDIIEIAKVLTGWIDFGHRNVNRPDFGSEYRDFRHDKSTKQLSDKFGAATIDNQGADEYSALIDIIFQQDEVSRFICRKLYRWFVFYDITDDVETNVIEPMSQILRDNDYNIRPVVKALLTSEHFYDTEVRGCMIKNPFDFLISIFRQHEVQISEELEDFYNTNLAIARFVGNLQMTIFEVPSVAGWKAFYQGPNYYQIWINNVTMQLRKVVADAIGANQIRLRGSRLVVPALQQIAKFDNPQILDNVIDGFVQLKFTKGISEEQRATLRQIILQGLPDFEWTVEYEQYLADPENEDLAVALDQKLRLLIIYMMRMPEYQLS